MTTMNRLVDGCLRYAASRWPADIRDDRYREWSAELYMIKQEPHPHGAMGQWFEQLRYALSLATSPPADDENQVPRGWQEVVPGWGKAMRPALILAGLAALCLLIIGAFRTLFSSVMSILIFPGFGPATGTETAVHHGAMAVAIGVAAVLCGWIGHRVARVLPLPATSGTRLGRRTSAIAIPVLLTLGMLVVMVAHEVSFSSLGSAPHPFPVWLAGLVLWMVVFIPLLGYLMRLARRGRTRPAIVLGVAAALIIMELTGLVMTVLALIAQGAPVMEVLPFLTFPSSTTAGLLAVSTFAVCYSISAAAKPIARPTTVVDANRSVAAPPVSAARRNTGFATAAVAALAWAAGLAFISPAAVPFGETADTQMLTWAYELRIGALVAFVLGLCLALVGRGRPFVPAAVTMVSLLVADAIIGGNRITHAMAFIAATATAAIMAIGFDWLSRNLMASPPEEATTRRSLIGLAITAAFCAPAPLLQSTWPESTAEAGGTAITPFEFPAATATIAATLSIIAMAAALAARRRPLPKAAAVAMLATPTLLLAGLGALSGLPGNSLISMLVPSAPMAALAWFTIGLSTAGRPSRRRLLRAGIAIGSLIAILPSFVAVLLLGMIAGGPLQALANAGPHADGITVMTGTTLLAIGLGTTTALWMVRIPRLQPSVVTTYSQATN